MGLAGNRIFVHWYRRMAHITRAKKQAMNKAPCKNCERRVAHPNCHVTCQEYKDFVIERQQYREERQKQSLIAEYVKQKHERLEKLERRCK